LQSCSSSKKLCMRLVQRRVIVARVILPLHQVCIAASRVITIRALLAFSKCQNKKR
jgi:hypothetical protein